MHSAYFDVGADVVETNTFGSFAVPLGEYDIAERAHEITLAGARWPAGRRRLRHPDRPRYVAGSIGPGTKFAEPRPHPFADLRDPYEVAGRRD